MLPASCSDVQAYTVLLHAGLAVQAVGVPDQDLEPC